MRVICVIAAAMLAFSHAAAQDIKPKQSFVVNMDYSRFRYTDREGYLEVSLGIYPSLLTLRQEQDAIRGEVEVQAIIREKGTDTVVAARRVSIPIVVADTTSASLNRWFVSKLVFAVPFGSYTMEVRSRDAARPAREDSARVFFTIDSLKTRPAISDVDLCTNITESDRKDGPFYKNTYEVIPNPSLFFGSAGSPVIFTYAEFYQLEIGRTYSVTAAVVDGRGQVLKSRTRPRIFGVHDAVDVSTLPVTALNSGKFLFRLTLADSAGSELVRCEKPVFIFNPNVQAPVTAAVSAGAVEFAGMTNDELVAEFRRARYLASDEQVRTFERLTSEEAQREFMAKFWAQAETEATPYHGKMSRMEFLRRVGAANDRYAGHGHEGWLTDRGRVYLLYGEPDDVERFPSQGDSKPYEIWHYYGIENGVEFDFVDRAGLNDYVLVHSTKRGELQDDGWQRYLR